MSKAGLELSQLTNTQKREYLKQLLKQRAGRASQALRESGEKVVSGERSAIPQRFYRFDKSLEYLKIKEKLETSQKAGVQNPFFRTYDKIAGATTWIDGREFVNFTNTNFLNMSGDPVVAAAAKEAIDKFGTSVSASRVVSGQRAIHVDLEQEIAGLLGVDDALVFSSGFVTNLSTIGELFGPKDLILHDELAHNSIIQGSISSGARRIPFPHSDWKALERLLQEHRRSHEKVVIIIEGQYGMDGDLADPRPAIRLKKAHKAFLMIDEAHSMGLIGKRGFGVSDYFDLKGEDVDIWMGTLSKSFASSGGYIAGCRALIEQLRYTAPAAVYSVGLNPPSAAAALAAIRLMKAEPERVQALQANARLFLELARERKLDTGLSMGMAIVPVIIGSSFLSVFLSNGLLKRGINVQPILHPAVPEKTSRLRFFMSCAHTEEQIRETVDAVAEELRRLRKS